MFGHLLQKKIWLKAGHEHVKTLHGSINTDDFYRLSDIERFNLRKRFNLDDKYVVGFVFRNQLRKSVPNLLDGFKIFKKDCPQAKLLCYTLIGQRVGIYRDF